jgi:putative FmdB family regulatory protein
MPVYEYECKECGIFEEYAKITAEPRKRCPDCRKKVERLISTNSFSLVGTDWFSKAPLEIPTTVNGKKVS